MTSSVRQQAAAVGLAGQLRSVGLRVTTPRLAVLTVLREGGHHTVEALATEVRERIGAVSTQAVYDVLHALVEVGLARAVEPAGGARRYEARVGDNHHHLLCRNCGTVVDVDCAVGTAPCLEPVTRHGYLVETAEVTWWGICPACQPAGDRQRPANYQEATR